MVPCNSVSIIQLTGAWRSRNAVLLQLQPDASMVVLGAKGGFGEQLYSQASEWRASAALSVLRASSL